DLAAAGLGDPVPGRGGAGVVEHHRRGHAHHRGVLPAGDRRRAQGTAPRGAHRLEGVGGRARAGDRAIGAARTRARGGRAVGRRERGGGRGGQRGHRHRGRSTDAAGPSGGSGGAVMIGVVGSLGFIGAFVFLIIV